MRLITVFGRGEHNILPWLQRSWESPSPNEDFCIKRTQFTNDSVSDCKQQPGCLSC